MDELNFRRAYIISLLMDSTLYTKEEILSKIEERYPNTGYKTSAHDALLGTIRSLKTRLENQLTMYR